MVIVFTDSDGVLKDNKNLIAQELIDIITQVRMRHNVKVIRITGAPSHHLNDGLVVDRAFGESGGIERLPDGTVSVVPYAHEAIDALKRLKQSLSISTEDGFATTHYGSVGVEGIRYTTWTLFFGIHPLYPRYITSANADSIADWIKDKIIHLGLPLYLMRGKTHTYEYLDIGHPEVMKKERIVKSILANASYTQIYYLGDSGNDAGAMQLPEVIPVTFSNAMEQIQRIVHERNGIKIEKSGPYGGSEEFFRRLMEEMV